MKNNLLNILSIFFLSNLYSQAIVSGAVSGGKNGDSLAGANITIKNQNEEYGVSTDRNGFFTIGPVPKGDYSFIVSHIGFEDHQQKIDIGLKKTFKINIRLDVQPILMAKLEILSDAESQYQNLPGAATVLSKQALKLISPIGTQEMLEYVPGVNGFSDDGIGNSRISIGIRGLNPRRSSRVLILEDGVPIQPALYVYPNMYYNPPAERLDEIEVIKGSASINYGPQTMGGVINYYTKRPRNSFGGLLKVIGGENGYGSLFAEVGGWGNNKLKPEIQFLVKRGDGFRENNTFQQVNATFKLNYRQSKNKNIYLKANLNYEDSEATYTGLTEWSFENDPRFNPKENDNFKVFRNAVDLIQTEKINSKVTENTTIFGSYFDRRWWRENDIYILADSLGTSTPRSIDPNNTYSNLVRTGNGLNNFGILRTFYVAGIERSYSIDHSVLTHESKMEIGVRGYWERFIDDRKAGDSVDDREGYYYSGTVDEPVITEGQQSHHYETTALSSFITESIQIGQLNLRPGLRFEIFEQERVDRLRGSTYLDKTEYVVLPGVGFSQNILGLKLFGGLHRGYTPPSSGALKILNFGENSDATGLDLKSEKSWNKEFGLRGTVSILKFELAGFHIGIENLVAAGRGTAFKNLGKVTNLGLELNGKLHFSNLTRLLPNLNFSYTFLSTEITDGEINSNINSGIANLKGNDLPYAPQNTLNIGIESIASEKISFRADLKYVSQVYTDFENIETTQNKGIRGSVPAYTIYNLSAMYNINSSLSFSFSGKNITDEIYIGSRLHSNPGMKDANISSGILPGARRQINVGLEYSF